MIKEGSRNVHMLRCKKKQELKTTRCLLCGEDFMFEQILYHLKKTHCAWNHITHIKNTEQQQQHHQDSSDTDSEMETVTYRIVDGHIAPPPSPAVNQQQQQQQKEEVPEEIFQLVEELKTIGATEQKLQEERQQQQAAPEITEDLNEINKEDLVKFEDFDFNLFLL